jgi:hypothetical protein
MHFAARAYFHHSRLARSASCPAGSASCLQAALLAALQAGQADVHVLAELLLSLMEYQHFHEFHWNS